MQSIVGQRELPVVPLGGAVAYDTGEESRRRGFSPFLLPANSHRFRAVISMSDTNTSNERIEQRSLAIGKWGNLLMAVAGAVAAYLSHADALLVDGLYSGVNFVSAIVAAWISVKVARPADRGYPFGYDAYEALYVTFRSLVLLGVMAFAVFSALGKICTYATGGEVPELVLKQAKARRVLAANIGGIT